MWTFSNSTRKGQLKNVQDEISRPLGSREIQKTKVETVLWDTLYFCEDSFGTKAEVMKHKRRQHEKTVKYCNKENCLYNEETCWFKHKTKEEETENVKISNENTSVFWKRQNNLKKP